MAGGVPIQVLPINVAGLIPHGPAIRMVDQLVRVRERQFHAVLDGDKILNWPAKSVAEDRSGALWIAMLSGGLGRWQSGEYTNLPMTSGVPRAGNSRPTPSPRG